MLFSPASGKETRLRNGQHQHDGYLLWRARLALHIAFKPTQYLASNYPPSFHFFQSPTLQNCVCTPIFPLVGSAGRAETFLPHSFCKVVACPFHNEWIHKSDQDVGLGGCITPTK
ncbi:hypothetical protein XPA_003282 [Xanthoria parietina]